MKKITNFSPLIALLLTSCAQFSPKANRQTANFDGRENGHENNNERHYDGPQSDLDRRIMDRDPGQMSYCEKYKDNTAKHVLACSFGIEEAQKMAQGFAGGHGREDGYARGYAWGINKIEKYTENNPEEIKNGNKNADTFFSDYLSRAQADGANPGANDGNSLGTTEAKGKFLAAVDTKKFPANVYTIPPVSYPGVSHAYAKMIGSIPDVEDYLRHQNKYQRLPIFDEDKDDYMNHRGHRSLGASDVWNHDGNYEGESQKWLNANTSFDLWKEMRNNSKSKYDSLNTITYNNNEGAKTGRFPAQEDRPRDPNNGKRDRGDHGENNKVPAPTTPAAPVVDYQAIFKDAFVTAYVRYAPFYYTRSYYATLDDGQRDGEKVGYEIGHDIAYKKGLAIGFDQLYQETSQNAYRQAFEQSYAKGFT